MGCWGIGNFDNDHAREWAVDLRGGAGFDAVARVLYAELNGARIGVPAAAVSLAAAEVVAALLGRPSRDLPVEVARWVAENRGQPASEYRSTALNHVRAVLSGHSDLRAMWAAKESEYPFWKATVESLIARLEVSRQDG